MNTNIQNTRNLTKTIVTESGEYPRETEEKGLLASWLVLRKRWMPIAFTFILFLAGGVFYTARQPRLYRASSAISITAPQPRRIGNIQVDQTADLYTNTTYINTQMEILQSRSMGEKVIKLLPAAVRQSFLAEGQEKFTEGNLLQHLEVSRKRDTDIVYINCIGKNPEHCAQVADLVTRVFIEDNQQRNENNQTATLEWLKKETPIVRQQMLDTRDELWEFEKQNPEVLSVLRENGQDSDMSVGLRRELQNIEVRLSSAEIVYNKCQKAQQDGSIEAILALDFCGDNALLQQLREQKFDLEKELDEYLLRYRDQHPKVVGLTQNIKKLDEKIRTEAMLVIKRQEQVYQDLKEQKIRQEEKLQSEWAQILAFKKKHAKYEHDRKIYESLQKMYDNLIEKLKQLDTTADYRIDNVRLIDKALIPGAPYKPNKFQNYLLICTLGLMAGIGLAFLLEMLDETVKNPEEIQQLIAAPILGFVPYLRGKEIKGKIPRAVEEKDYSAVAESFRCITTSLLLANKDEKSHSFVITSPLACEGKTTTLCNLGLTLAKAGHKVLLVDGDLRRPRLRSIFDLQKGPGFSDVLQGQSAPQDAIREVKDNLWCMAAGSLPDDSYESFQKGRLEDILRNLEEHYRYILIDSPPIGIADDAILLGKAAGSILFLVAMQRSHKKMLKQLVQRLQTLELPLQGVILNDPKGDLSARLSYYNYYGHYYYKTYYDSYGLQKQRKGDGDGKNE